MTPLCWPALDAAFRAGPPRRNWLLDGRRVGSVALHHTPLLAAWPQWIAPGTDALDLKAADATAALAEMNVALRAAGHILAWRDETFPVLPEGARAGDAPLALIERAAARFWGTLTFGAHGNGYVADAAGRPTHLWIARRSMRKATDPGKLDNLVGGGVPQGQGPFETLVREGFEEAGLDAATMRRATPGSVLHFRCGIAEGFMNEHLHTFDLRLDASVRPVNQDGEVDEWHCMTIDEALDCAAGEAMTMDAAVVTLDFALRHRLLPAQQADTLARRLAPLILR
jgi:8-oxo-dGTP pyrophosphatase MutT (NUDIX family)